jgi:two-component system, OmpR family, KDP operon response regulator KdpE
VTLPAPAVLVVEDEAHMRRFLSTTLSYNGYEPVEVARGAAAVDAVRTGRVSLVLLDLGLPDMDGVEVAAKIREASEIPIIVISARSREDDKIAALDQGANDYVTKPFGAGELLARIRVALRVNAKASAGGDAPVFTCGDLRIDLHRRQVFLGEAEVHLTPTEMELLSAMARRAGRVVSHRELLRIVWGKERENETQYLRVFMRQLRYKLEPEPAQPRFLLTVPGIGYRLRADP